MYVKKNYGFWRTFNWSKKPFVLGTIYALLIFAVEHYTQLEIAIPWAPIGVIGIAVAFYLGFKNNSSYDRTWEARKIYGGIVNSSRSLGVAIKSFIEGDNQHEIQRELIYRHVAWLTALRHQLRLSRPWEHQNERVKNKFAPVVCEDYNNRLHTEIDQFLSKEEVVSLQGKANLATQILEIQGRRFQELKNQGYFEDFRHMQFFDLIKEFYIGQGKAERIKNFPFPRQYASTALWLTIVFAILIPFGLLDIFKSTSMLALMVSPLLSGLVTWVFFLMEKIGDYSENPFEGTYNDVPITTISRGIEIDLRQMIDDENVPPAFGFETGFQL
jgi:ion channel-forming bestrophin family protein